jgi:hypothetical protein
MGTLGILVAVAILIGLFSYFTNAGLGDRKPKELTDGKSKPPSNGPPSDRGAGAQDSAGAGEPPPSR